MKKALAFVLLCLAAAAAPAANALGDEVWYRTAFLISCQKGSSVTGWPMIVGRYKINDWIFERYFPLADDGCPKTIAFDQ
jgi:hypothetical protein